MIAILAVFGVAAAAGVLCTWLARELANQVGLVDRPDGRRKLQARPVAVAGGVGVLAATILALAGAVVLVPDAAAALRAVPTRTLGLLAAAVVIAAVGLIDDALNLRARHKLLGQLAAVLLLVYPGGFVIQQVSLVGWQIELGTLAVPVTAFWFLAAINALNLLDGMDGLLGTIGVIIVGSLAWMAFAVGNPFAGWVAVALAGGLLGFLRFNLPPASVYLGDCGSMLIGLAVGALAIQASLKGPAVAIVAPSVLLVLPILDTSAAIIRRKLTGRGLAVADRGHLHHVLQKNGMTRGRVLFLVAGLGGVAAGGALIGTFLQNDLLAVLSFGVVVIVLLTTGLFGTAEVRLIKERAAAVCRAARGQNAPVELAVRLQGTADWASVWRRLVAAADELNLHSVRLDVTAAGWQEDFHGRWDRASASGPLDVWRLDLPVVGHGQVIGRLAVAGVRSAASLTEQLVDLSRVVAEAEATAARVVPPSLPAAPTPPVGLDDTLPLPPQAAAPRATFSATA